MRAEGGQTALRQWYEQLRLIDQLLLNQHLQPDEVEEIRGGSNASFFMEVSIGVDPAPLRANKPVAPAAPKGAAHAAAAKDGAKDVKLGSSFAALEVLDGLEGEQPLSRSQLKKKAKQEVRARSNGRLLPSTAAACCCLLLTVAGSSLRDKERAG